ncbi:MAG: lysophospholipid acyltransferase family protein [Trichodesmium sp. St2_bin6]|nr:acyltransferase family protein [Trichodesmium sp. MAG_R01]MDE5069381.1 lysophospholipid acyltransferase family protein [Trichodesmium sp. St4_bin8_1]MDE5073750.1 lysophospholipid acyltransferase family protein [Trichodesmium sp. St5_bin8]MDE5079659.1 lysophospholipid acyltransferase family protein [Trichodesmium sp. St2_bin6]MDE5091296.1 lysophospholipid acyltransferase family protein [Trichodesmium sp. St18_bin3_1_1]MDE5103378.1 lysophospholipid acyltransferase family protein [Trichodesmiu
MTANQQNMRQPYDGWSLDERDPEVIKSMMPLWEWFYRYYFRVQTDGWHHIPDEKILIVGSHNGGLPAPDMHMCMYDWFKRFGPKRLAYGLMHQNAWSAFPSTTTLAVQCGAVRAHPKMGIAAFQRNASVIVYPGGGPDVFRPHSMRNKIYFAERKGFIKLALREEVPIVPMISNGAHDTLIVLADFYEQAKQLHKWGMPWLFDLDPEVFPIYIGLPWGLAIGPLPNFPFPVQIHTRVCPPIVFERYGRKAASDRAYVDACYQKVLTQMQQELDELILSTS